MPSTIHRIICGAAISILASFAALAQEIPPPPGLILTWTGDPTTSIVIDWHRHAGDSGRAATISVRPRGTLPWTTHPATRFPFPFSNRVIDRVEIEGLEPDTEYEFRGSRADRTYWFRTMPATLDRPLVIAAGGDVRHNKSWMSAMNETAMEHDPDFVVWGGDLAYADGRADRIGHWYEFLDSMVETLVTPDGRVPPVVVGIGNHEIRGGYHQNRINSHADRLDLAPYFYTLFAFPGDPGYGVLDFGDYLSIVMGDSEHSNPVPGAQTDWMRQTLEERRNFPHLIPVYHVPAWPSARSFNTSQSALVRQHWVPLFEQNNIRLVLENHDHTYKRTVPIFEGEANAARGVVYVGDGSWGVNTRSVHSVSNTWYLEKAQSVRHCLIITIHPKHKEVRAITANGTEIDSITIPSRDTTNLVRHNFDGGDAPLHERQVDVNTIAGSMPWVSSPRINADGVFDDPASSSRTNTGAYLDLGEDFAFLPDHTYALTLGWSEVENAGIFLGFANQATTPGENSPRMRTMAHHVFAVGVDRAGEHARIIAFTRDDATSADHVTTTPAQAAGNVTLTLETRNLTNATFRVPGLETSIPVDLDAHHFRYLFIDFEDNGVSEATFDLIRLTAVPTPSGRLPQVINLSYDAADGSAVATIHSAEPLAVFKLVESPTLDFANPTQDPVPLLGATHVTIIDGTHVRTDENGVATIQFNLGTGPANFIRAEQVDPENL